CDDQDACTVDSCDTATGACSHEPVSCDDGNACTEQTCVASTGACAYAITDCDDASVCTLDSCDATTGCVHDAIVCEDGNPCNGAETCDATNGCVAGLAVTCDDDDVCNGLESCDPDTGACVDGMALVCTDGNPCNGSEYCLADQGCTAGMPMNCDDGIPCTLDSCDTEMWVCVNQDVCAEAMTDGMMVYSTPADDGNTFACNTCHALDEPAEDGIRRSGHRLGDATRRPSYKNGLLTDMLDAANSCRTGWMNASAWDETDPSWLALYTWLDGQAPEGDAPALEFEIVPPPEDPTGGDAEAGQDLFNMACVMCHGMDAVGTLRGPPLAGTNLPPSYIALRVRTSGDTDSPVYDALTGGIMPFWSASRLTDDEVRNLAAFVSTSTAPEPEPPDDPIEPIEPGPDCDATHARVGWTTTLSTKFHGVQGVATMVDDCTIVVEDFYFDGNGIDVQVYAGDDGDYNGGFSISDQLYNFPTGYEADTLILKLPADKTLDDVDGISVWCVTVGVSFGDGLFAPP
ncbi:MAG: DM13 domain-containing protein, partial [Myxococcota bacterium]|nr:DM13 domain-containing protein [Myxococcota bacterium]